MLLKKLSVRLIYLHMKRIWLLISSVLTLKGLEFIFLLVLFVYNSLRCFLLMLLHLKINTLIMLMQRDWIE